ncbi:MAG: hypothetical protein K0U84_24650 [Actinomycetia bacterium]|nr:hypothetical protein [Actinomycetes bacterium]
MTTNPALFVFIESDGIIVIFSARQQLSGLPPTYIDVGELDIFRNEDTSPTPAALGTGGSIVRHRPKRVWPASVNTWKPSWSRNERLTVGFEIDPQVLEELAPLLAAEAEPPAVGDVAARRHNNRQLFAQALASRPPVPGIDVDRYSVVSDDGATVRLSWYRRADSAELGSAVLYVHGGGDDPGARGTRRHVRLGGAALRG